MSSHVVFQSMWGGTRIITLCTTIRFFTGMCSLVSFQSGLIWTYEITLCTTIRFFTGMCSHVCFQIISPMTAIITYSTTVEFLFALWLDFIRRSCLVFSSLLIRSIHNVSIFFEIVSGPGVQYLDVRCWRILIWKLQIFILFGFPGLWVIMRRRRCSISFVPWFFNRIFTQWILNNVVWETMSKILIWCQIFLFWLQGNTGPMKGLSYFRWNINTYPKSSLLTSTTTSGTDVPAKISWSPWYFQKIDPFWHYLSQRGKSFFALLVFQFLQQLHSAVSHLWRTIEQYENPETSHNQESFVVSDIHDNQFSRNRMI